MKLSQERKSCGYILPADVPFEPIKHTAAMGAYNPSTRLDFEAGRALEVEAIWGEPLPQAQGAGADAATGTALHPSENLACATAMRLTPPPPVTIRNLQRRVLVSKRGLQRFAAIACNLVWQCRRPRSDITSLHRVEVLMVSDQRMAALHKQFCGVSGATDVLTFQHGEIVISADTAARQARTFQSSLTAEIHLYLLHGLLHLAGFSDATPPKRRQMDRLQKKLMTIISAGRDDRD